MRSFQRKSGNSTDPVGLFYVTGSEEDFGFSVQAFQFDPDDEDGLGAPQAGITVDPDTGELSVAGNVDSGTYKVVVTAQDADGNETSLTFTLLLGTNGADTMPGANFVLDPDGNNILVGLGGADNLTGSDGVDYILGSQGNDGFTSSLGADWYHLGGNNDTIHFTDVLHSNPLAFDTIMDWGNGSNTINLSQIDANTNVAGNLAFAFGGETSDVVANSITWYQDGVVADGTAVTIIQGDVNGNTDADLMIVLLGHHDLAAGDFVLG